MLGCETQQGLRLGRADQGRGARQRPGARIDRWEHQPEEALRLHLPAEHKHWVLHPDSKTSTYARIENPISFVSDAIDNLNAQPGALIRNSKNELQFQVELVERELIDEKILDQEKAWARDAAAALRTYLAQKKRSGRQVIPESTYSAVTQTEQVEKKLGKEKFFRARVLYKLSHPR